MNISELSIQPAYFTSLSRIFTPSVLDKVAENGFSEYLNEIVCSSELLHNLDLSKPFRLFLNDVYQLFSKDYRNEYLYKNEIAKKVLLERHSLLDSWMLNEFRVGRCRADVVILNGTSTVYEIKSQFDSFKRLNDQIDAYRKVFDHIYVVTSEPKSLQLMSKLPDLVGILSLTTDNTLNVIKPSISNKHDIKPEVLFDSLRKIEYTEIIQKIYGYVPDVPNTEIYEECKHMFCNQEPVAIHDITIETLKNRNRKRSLTALLENAPEALYAYIINYTGNARRLMDLEKTYDTQLAELIHQK